MFAIAMVVMEMLTKMETFAVPEELKDMCVASWGWQGGSGTLQSKDPAGWKKIEY